MSSSTITIKKLTSSSATRIEELERELVQLRRRDKLAAQIESLDVKLVAARDAAVDAERKFDAWMLEHSAARGSIGDEAAFKAMMWEAATEHFRAKRSAADEHAALLEERCEAKRQIAHCGCFCTADDYDDKYECEIAATDAMMDAYGGPKNMCGHRCSYCRLCERVSVIVNAPPLFALGITLYEHKADD